jgi:hypothetical protein
VTVATAQKPVVVLVGLVAASVLLAGCIVQNRPEAESFLVVADAGPNLVVPGGSAAHFEWAYNQSVQGEAGHVAPEVEAHHLWANDASPTATSTNESFSFGLPAPSFALVSLTVSVEKSSASDVAGVLFVPGSSSAERRAYVAVIGAIGIATETADPVNEHHLGAFVAQETQRSLGGPTAHLRFDLVNPNSLLGTPAEGSLIIAIKDGVGPARTTVTPPLEFEGGESYTLVLDPRPAAQHEIEIARPGAANKTVTLDEFVHAHEGEHEVETVVTHSQTLPGFEGAAAVVSATLVGLSAALMRRRA